MSWNVQGMTNKIDIINYLVERNLCDILCFSEHCLKSAEVKSVWLPGFKTVSFFCRSAKCKGGTAVFIRDSLECIAFNRQSIEAEELSFELSAVFF